jgi:hypothetical protein
MGGSGRPQNPPTLDAPRRSSIARVHGGLRAPPKRLALSDARRFV